jgi:hypothetical protein
VYAQPSYGYAVAPPKGLSITSMILGIAGVVFLSLGFLPALGAVITGHLASRSQPYAKGFWMTGLVTGYIGIAISVIFVGFFILVALVAPSTR